MNIIKDIFEYEEQLPASVVTIGKFDGLHRGHQALLNQTLAVTEQYRAQCGAVHSVVFTFDMSPVMLLTKKERRKRLEEQHFDTLIECAFSPKIITMSPEDFITKILVGRLHARHIVIGDDFHFGYERRGTIDMLRKMGKEYEFTVDAVPTVMDGWEKISSSTIRKALMRGQMEKVNELLGYPYTVRGNIIHGNQIGRTIGVPTANIIPSTHKLLPPNGVYDVRTTIDGKQYFGITNIGTKPTVDGSFIGVETFLFDFDGDIYGKKMAVELLHFARPEVRFGSLEELRAQIKTDESDGRAFFQNYCTSDN